MTEKQQNRYKKYLPKNLHRLGLPGFSMTNADLHQILLQKSKPDLFYFTSTTKTLKNKVNCEKSKDTKTVFTRLGFNALLDKYMKMF